MKERHLERENQQVSAASGRAVKSVSTPAGQCPQCGASNDPEAMFCENCGALLRESVCPHCGAPVDPATDLCEACGKYISQDRCSFCSAALTDQDTFCPECGAPRDGIQCPVCHTKSMFAFCPACGTALTDSARAELEKAREIPFLNKMQDLENEIEKLWMTVPAANAKEKRDREKNLDIRSRVLKLLENDGEKLYEQVRESRPIVDEAELEDTIEQKRQELQRLLDKMEMPAQESPAQARIFSMARRPGVSKLGWKCNYKQALHSSPLGCACPQQGGKWIVLNSENMGALKDDK